MASKTVPNKICFIICYNNTEYLNEAILYLQQLVVPEGYITDLLCIEEAGSMAEGYQHMHQLNYTSIIRRFLI